MIMHIITSFEARAGAETMLARLLHVSRGERVVVVPLIAVSERNKALAANPDVVYEPQEVRSPLDVPVALRRIAGIIRRERPRAIVCWMYHAMIVGTVAAKLSRPRARLIWNVRQSLDDLSSMSRNSRIAVELARWMSAVPDVIIYNSRRALQLHRAYGYRNGNSLVIPNGFTPPALASGPFERSGRLGIAARFHSQKDYPTFFRAAALTRRAHPQARFVAVGNGVHWQNATLIGMIDDAGLPRDAVELRGETDDMASFFNDIDGLVLSSRTEGFPNVIAEAMSYGKPVVTTDVGDAAAIVGSTGFIARPSDPESLADGMRNLIGLTEQDYARRSLDARRLIEESYSLEAIASRYLDAYGSAAMEA